MVKELLIIFQKNPISGKVKTRLARETGENMALSIYKMLIEKTFQATQKLSVEKWVFYTDYIDTADIWTATFFKKHLQTGKTLGEKMLMAFEKGFNSGFNRICIIGTDCYDISGEIIKMAFINLENYDYVIGPANDGGYYLLGMNTLHKPLFENKHWSTDSVLQETVQDIKYNNQTYFLLPELTDIDKKEDLSVIKPDDLKAIKK